MTILEQNDACCKHYTGIHKAIFARGLFLKSYRLRLFPQRLSLNLTQATLAEKPAIGVITIARIESGQSSTLNDIIRLAIALGMVNHFAELFDMAPINIENVIAKQNLRLRA